MLSENALHPRGGLPMAMKRRPAVEPLDEGDVELLRYMRRNYRCQVHGANCPAGADCPEGFYICDAIVNMVQSGTNPELGSTAKQVVRYLYDQLSCEDQCACPAAAVCDQGELEPCEVLLLKLGVEV